MKKLILPILVVLMVSSVLALPFGRFIYPSLNIRLIEKENFNCVTDCIMGVNWWNEVTHGMRGNVLLSQGDRVKAILLHAEPYTEYTLIYYGDETHNDVWNYATCITSGRTNKGGNVRMRENRNFDYRGFIGDPEQQKFWIVPSSDVDCENGRMIAWNPENYLFERFTI